MPEFPRAVPDLAGAAASLGLLLLAILARCARKPTLPPPTLQQTLLDAPPPAPTTFLPSVGATVRTLVAAFLLYVLAGAECVEFGFGGFSAYFTLLARAGGYLALALAAEAEHSPRGLAAPRGAAASALWRGRAALRCAAAAALGWSRVAAVAADFAAADWASRALALGAALGAASLALVALAGPPALVEVARRPPPMRPSWLLSKLLYLFWWREVAAINKVDTLAVSDLPQLDPTQTSAACWAAVRPNDGATKRSLLRELLPLVRRDMLMQFAWTVYTLAMVYAAPLGMLRLIDFVGGFDGGAAVPPIVFGYAALVAIGPLLSSIGDAHTFGNGWMMGTKLRAYVTRAVCEKALRYDPASASESVGELTNLLAVDANNLVNFAPGSSWVVLEGLQLLLTLAILFFVLGWAATGGVVVCLIAFPINAVVMRRIKILQERLMKQKDSRMALVTEAVGAVRTLKLHGWENAFEGRIKRLRDAEIATLRRYQMLNAVTSTLWLTSPTLAALASFLVKNLILGQPILAAEGFTALTLFQLLSVSLTFLPAILNQGIQAKVGLNRISRFLALPEVDGRSDGAAAPGEAALPPGEVRVVDATFAWPTPPKPPADAPKRRRFWRGGRKAKAADADGGGTAPLLAAAPININATPTAAAAVAAAPRTSTPDGSSSSSDSSAAADEKPPSLRHVDMSVRPGELCLIVGATGGGKSTLLSALLGNVRRVNGSVAVGGRVAYCPQKAWVLNATLKDNILFGAAYDEARYGAVLDACALRPDLALLPAGDATEIGERGVNLSGGQQQRVNLARASYAYSDVVILDDVLSAVDAHVAQHLFDHAICGLLKDRTRLLVTHAVALTLRSADQVVVVGDGQILARGPPDAPDGEIARLRGRLSASSSRNASAVDLAALDAPKPAPEKAAAAAAAAKPKAAGDGAAAGTITKTEERARGAAALSTYTSYVRAAGGLRFGLCFLCVCVVYSTISPFQSVALKAWMAAMAPGPGGGESGGAGAAMALCALYTGLSAAFLLVTLFRNLLLPQASVMAARRLHAAMTHSVLRAPVAWFEGTPLGRVLNRFSSDISQIDQVVATQFKDCVQISLNTLAIAAVCTAGSGELASQLVVLCAVALAVGGSFAVFRVYRPAARELKRLESLTKSPLFATFGELVSGAHVIRAFGDERRVISGFDTRVDDANRALYNLWVTNQWLRVSMNAVGSLVTASVVTTVLWQGANLDGGDAGLTLSYSTQFTQAVMWLFRIFTQLEVSMNDVERVNEYVNLASERYDDDGAPPSDAWPADGAIVFEDVAMKYASAHRPVFSSLSFSIAPRTRVGVVGRTGAGKSSLAVALFRIVELSGGRITIDGVDHTRVPLAALRSRLSIIQQEPTLFRGTMRYNLAPTADEGEGGGDASDARLWDALRRAGLDERVRALAGGLDADVSEGGSNFSAGERQLVCMARALLRRSSVLVMDEATASVDHETDGRIQQMIKDDFNGTATVLTVAHRLHTVVFYEKAMLLAEGGVLEYDAPATLLSKKDGAFRKLAEETGDLMGLVAAAQQ